MEEERRRCQVLDPGAGSLRVEREVDERADHPDHFGGEDLWHLP